MHRYYMGHQELRSLVGSRTTKILDILGGRYLPNLSQKCTVSPKRDRSYRVAQQAADTTLTMSGVVVNIGPFIMPQICRVRIIGTGFVAVISQYAE